MWIIRTHCVLPHKKLEVSMKAMDSAVISVARTFSQPSSEISANTISVISPSPPAEVVSVSSYLLDSLETLGVRYIFGVPGGTLVPFFQALACTAIQPVLVKHEAGAAFMADGFSRISGTLGVCCATSGPGATNALTGVACADADGVPLLLISGGTPARSTGRGPLQDSSPLGLDLLRIFLPATRFAATLSHASSAHEMMSRALRLAEQGGASYLHIPSDVQRAPLPVKPAPYRSVSLRRAPADAALEALIDALCRLRNPVVFAGHGVRLSRAEALLAEFAHTFGIPVITTPKGKGVFAENDPLSAGVYGAFGASPIAQAILDDTVLDTETSQWHGFDGVLVLGSSLGEIETHNDHPRLWLRRELMIVNIDPTRIDRHQPGCAVIADIGDTLKRLLASPQLQTMRYGSRERLEALRTVTPRYLEAEYMDSDTNPVVPQRMVRILQDHLPDDAHVFIDAGNCVSWMLHYYETRRTGHFHSSLGQASMGWSIGAAVGAQFATDRRCVAICGDGAFLMNGTEAHTAADHRLPAVFIVLNDGGHAMVAHGDAIFNATRVCPADYAERVDFAKVAEGMGLLGLRAQTPQELQAALQTVFAQQRAALIDVIIDRERVPPTLRDRIENLKKGITG
jgi:acetolactate synthase I/II/III large subunit